MHYTLRVALRFLKPKRRHFLLSILTLISIVGVMLSVAAPEVTLSVMSGFENEVRQRIVNTNYHVFVLSRGDFIDYQTVTHKLLEHEEIESVSPFVRREAMLSFAGGGSISQRFQPAVLMGIDPEKEGRTTRVIQTIRPEFLGFQSKLFDHDGQHLPGMVLGIELGKELGVSLGDIVKVATPKLTSSMQNMGDLQHSDLVQRFFRVIGFLNSGFYEFDAQLAFIDLSEAQEFLGFEDRVYGLGVRIKDIYEADVVGSMLDAELGLRYYTNNWIYMFRNVFTWMETERKLMRLLFMLLISIAVITVVGMLTMLVIEKRKAIGILKSMGASKSHIMMIFVIQGTWIGSIGAVLGSGLGLVACMVVDRIGIDLPGDVYIIDTLPVHIQYQDFVVVSLAAVCLSFLATLYPSWEAARLDPIEAIRYE